MLHTAEVSNFLLYVKSRQGHRATFDAHGHLAVAEPVHAAEPVSDRLRPGEAALDQHLRTLNKGRLEQEFLPAEAVHLAVRAWADKV